MRRSHWLISICVAWLVFIGLGVTASAQPEAGVKSRAATGTVAVRTPAPFALSMVYGRLLMSSSVKDELKLNADQKAKVNEATDKAHAAMRSLYAGVRDASPEEQQAKMEEVQKKMQAQMEETTKTVEGILEPKQLVRLKGLALQMIGISAIMDKEIQQDLKLSEVQVAKIKAAGEELQKKAKAMLRESVNDPKTLSPAAMQGLQADFEKELADVLTPEQKATLETMKGAKFDFPPLTVGPSSGGAAPPPAK